MLRTLSSEIGCWVIGDGGHQKSEERRVKSEEGLARRPKGKSMQVTFSSQRPRKEIGDRCWVMDIRCGVRC